MAENTEHYNLVKPDYADAADVSQLNDNMDTIDGILWQLANAGADEELLKKVQEILDKIGETDDTGGSYVSGSVMSKLNESLKETESIGGNVDTLIRLLSYGVFEKSTAGSFTVTLPETVSKIKVTACGGGGGGAGSTSTSEGLSYCYSGGGGGQAIVEQEYEVEPGSTITSTVGAAGSVTNVYKGNPGGATVINGIVTLAGGAGGVGTQMTQTGKGGYALAGGAGGGDAGAPYWISSETTNGSQYKSENGKDGILGKGGKGAYVRADRDGYRMSAGSGGGGSLGNGGNGAGSSTTGDTLNIQNPTAGTRGGGGGGGGSIYRNSNQVQGKPGGAGYVKIVWGY